MLGPELTSAVRAVDWSRLRSTYGPGEIVRDVVLGLASHQAKDARWAWQQMDETVLQHQGTVYPATAAAAPFLCQIALDGASLWRSALITELAFLACGHDQPFAPADTASAVREAIRPYAAQLLDLWGSGEPGLDVALVAVSVAFPAEAGALTTPLRDWFATAESPLRTALGLALAFHGVPGEAVEQILADEVGQSLWVVTRRGPLVAVRPGESPIPESGRVPSSPVADAIQVAERLRTGATEHTADFAPVFSFLLTLMESAEALIDRPG
jgi:hypothetical protein